MNFTFENENENCFLKTKILLGLLFIFPRASEKESFFFLFFNYIILYKPSSCQLKVFSSAKISPIARIQKNAGNSDDHRGKGKAAIS